MRVNRSITAFLAGSMALATLTACGGNSSGTSSGAMREQVVAARDIQTRRFKDSPTRHNGQMTHRQIRSFCQLDDPRAATRGSEGGGS